MLYAFSQELEKRVNPDAQCGIPAPETADAAFQAEGAIYRSVDQRIEITVTSHSESMPYWRLPVKINGILNRAVVDFELTLADRISDIRPEIFYGRSVVIYCEWGMEERAQSLFEYAVSCNPRIAWWEVCSGVYVYDGTPGGNIEFRRRKPEKWINWLLRYREAWLNNRDTADIDNEIEEDAQKERQREFERLKAKIEQREMLMAS